MKEKEKKIFKQIKKEVYFQVFIKYLDSNLKNKGTQQKNCEGKRKKKFRLANLFIIDHSFHQKMADTTQKKKPVRVWVDGCFDLFHFGHANALRQAKALGDYLIVGVHSDEDIRKHKGVPVMQEQTRYNSVRCCKWVDEVVEGAPYVTQLDILDKYNVDFAVHGDDLVTTATGEDTYKYVKEAGRFKFISRTRGVSTTDLVGRMLLHTRAKQESSENTPDLASFSKSERVHSSPYTGLMKFIPTTQKLIEFSEQRVPRPNDRVGYISGSFDLFHYGHMEILRVCKEEVDFLYVGLTEDSVVTNTRGPAYPIMNLHERALSVLACRYVDEVILGVGHQVTRELLDQLNVNVVLSGVVASGSPDQEGGDPYAIPKQLGIYKQLHSPSDITSDLILETIEKNRQTYKERNAKKEQKEISELVQNKDFKV